MSVRLAKKHLDQLTLFAGGFPAPISRWPEAARGWLERNQDCGLSYGRFLRKLDRESASLKMSLAFYPLTEDGTLPSSFAGWGNCGIMSLGQSWTHNGLEWRKDAAVCSLSEVLEMDVQPKYFLSPRACQGILKRSGRRGKRLPPSLQAALEQVAQQAPEVKANSASS